VSKYGAIPTVYGGQLYDSRGEAAYARHLDLLKAAGHIRGWRRGRRWPLVPGVTLRPDFEVTLPDGSLECRDFKGCVTREFTVKAKVWAVVYPTVPLVVVRADGSECRAA
jgi:hypothetical protein